MRRLEAGAVAAHLASGGTVVDVREPPTFAEAHARGSLNIALSNRSAPYWLDTLLAPGDRVLIVTASERDDAYAEQLIEAAERDAIGFAPFGADDFARAGVPIASFRTIAPDELDAERERLTVIDVREPAEYMEGHVPGALNIPLADLHERLGEVPSGPTAAICGSGFRSSTAASLLEAAGRDALANVWGGTTAWRQLGFPVNEGRRP